MGKKRPRAAEKRAVGHTLPLPPAPTFHPSESDFQNPLEYISSIRPLAEPYGLCLIIPPKSWSPPSLPLPLPFPTKSQSIHLLQSRPPSLDPQTFDLDYRRFRPLKPPPKLLFLNSPLPLSRLFHAVKRHGGFHSVSRLNLWPRVARLLSPHSTPVSAHVLRQLYRQHLLDFEQHLKAGTPSPDGPADQICGRCASGLHGDVMLLCDRCDKGWHLHCLSPPLEKVPEGNWYCLDCLNSEGDCFGFAAGKRCTVEGMRRMDEREKRRWFGQRKGTGEEKERIFWEIVEGRAGEVEVVYGSDLDTSVYGSGFPRDGDRVPDSVDGDVWRRYCASPWNLNNLPRLGGSMLRVVRDSVAGVMVPWLYVGMLFSAFCWHVEDHCFYSINYLHWYVLVGGFVFSCF